jgi:uncharacterized repeat protein (TIGR01451 family)
MSRALLLLAITSIIGLFVALSPPTAEGAVGCDSLGLPVERAVCIEKVAEPSVGVVGEPITFTITVRAEPCCSSSADRLIDYLPEGVDFVSATATQGECIYGTDPQDGVPHTVRCGPYTVGLNLTQVITITVVPTSPGSYVNVARHSTVRVEEPFEVREPAPSVKEDCKNGGYKQFGFRNQGQCIKAVKATN